MRRGLVMYRTSIGGGSIRYVHEAIAVMIFVVGILVGFGAGEI